MRNLIFTVDESEPGCKIMRKLIFDEIVANELEEGYEKSADNVLTGNETAPRGTTALRETS